jgi:SEL1 protein
VPILAPNAEGGSPEEFPPDFQPTQEQRDRYWSEGGNDIVHDIWSVLRDFESTWTDSVNTEGSSGLTGLAWYYTKATFRLLFMNAPTSSSKGQDGAGKITGDLASAVESLEHAVAYDDPDAIFLLAEMNFYGNFSHPRNFKEAFALYSELADLDGNSTAQYMLGFMHATGIGESVERDQAKALLYHTFAAEQGNTRAEMTAAYRHHAGIGTPRDCNMAVEYYKRVADKVMDHWQAGPPGGTNMPRDAYKWAEEQGGLYGEGASASSAGNNAGRDTNVYAVGDIMEFLDMRERQGDFGAVFSLGKHYYEGLDAGKRYYKKAQRQFMKIARAYWTKDGKVNPRAPKGIDKLAGKAAAYIGRMCLRGEGMEQNFEKAATWFRRGISNGDASCQFHMGLMFRDGLGVPKDGARAATYFKASAEQDEPRAQSALGALFLDQGDIDTAGRYFELAARRGLMEAYFYLAEMSQNGIGRERNCQLATAYYKIVAERGETVHSSFKEANAAYGKVEANAAYGKSDLERAFIATAMAAEQGYEAAQNNVAFLLDEQTSVLSLPSITPPIPLISSGKPQKSSKLLHNAPLALIYFTRSAWQSNIDALVKMGDYYLTPTFSAYDPDRASTCYTTAAETHHSAQALWNLGWMHENGIGSTAQDFHMAKRYYDLALEMNKEAYLPVKLALGKLRFRSWWNGISGGAVNGIQDDATTAGKDKPKTLTEWIARFLDAAEEMDNAEAAALAGEGDGLDLDATGRDFGADPMPGGDGDYFDEGDEGLWESLIIVGLAATLAFLVYLRQQRGQGQGGGQAGAAAALAAQAPVAGQAQAQAQQPAPVVNPAQEAEVRRQEEADNGGFFPAPGDPDWNQWVMGNVGP